MTLPVEPLSREAFQPFGQVIDATGESFEINDGYARRFHDQVRIEVGEHGRPCVSVFVARARALPLTIDLLEHHPRGSQAFVPMEPAPYLVVVAPPGPVDPRAIRAFVAIRQGVNYAPGTWHFPLISLKDDARFLVIDRAGPGDNCVETPIDPPRVIEALP
ncbi:MAG: ureidoglycolate lyase [Candidatus Competibacterales bacterium]|nr:ureidoglycolate lyase [Candidatus Competibacterales bacterium]